MSNLIEEVRLIKTEVDENANKWWRSQLYDDGTVKAQWARVGYPQKEDEWNRGESYFRKQIRSKLKKGYTYDRTVGSVVSSAGSGSIVKDNELHSIAKTQLIKSSNPTLERLIKRLVEANVHRITTSTQITYNDTTGLFSTPLGIVTPDGLVEARDLLDKITPYVRKGQYENGINHLVNQYLRIIPQNVGMKLLVRNIFQDDTSIQKQSDLIDALEASYQALQTQKPTEPKDTTVKPQEKVFEVDLDILSDDRERNRIVKWFENTKKKNHNYDSVRVREIFKVTLHDMVKSFDVNKKPVKEVWHGTSQANCLSILKSGLKVSPPRTARTAGKLFGNGIYGAFNSTKSLGYTFGKWGQGGVGDAGWLFVCEFAMGKTYETTAYGCNCPKGYDSIWAKSSGGGLYNDEIIVYSDPQVNIKYLLECK
jgi:poly [ADP-ribose] polymerase